MTSKVLVKLPVVPFSQKGSSCDDVLQRSKKPPAAASNSGNNAASSESATGEAESSDARPHEHSHEDKVAQLEQNVKFLQEQHQTMLVALHKEIDQLRQRNRELQFQLVFSSKGPKISPCGISSPEDATTVPSCSNKLKESPTNIMPLQIELLEKDVQELRVCLDEEKKLNASLSATIDKQQQELARAAAPTERATAASSDKAVQVDTTMECQQVEMQARLVDAEALVKRLRQENVEQRKELGQLKQQVSSSSTTSSSSSSSSSSRNGRSAATHRVPAPPSSSYYNPSSAAPIAALASIDPQQPQLSDEQQHQQTFPKFPPLQTQSYWHRASRTNHGGYDSGPQLHNYQRNARHHNHHHQSHHQHQPAQQHPQQQQQQQQYQQHHHQQLNQESRHQHHHNRHQAPPVQQQQLKDGQAKPPGSSSSSSSSAASSSLLPQLRNGSVRVDTSGSSYPPFFRARSSHGHSYYKDNNCDQPQPQQPQQSRGGNNRKYRGPKPPRRENGHHPQDGGGTPRDYTGNQQQHHNRDNQRQPRKPRS